MSGVNEETCCTLDGVTRQLIVFPLPSSRLDWIVA